MFIASTGKRFANPDFKGGHEAPHVQAPVGVARADSETDPGTGAGAVSDTETESGTATETVAAFLSGVMATSASFID